MRAVAVHGLALILLPKLAASPLVQLLAVHHHLAAHGWLITGNLATGS